ncbi:MAG: hypothetical protein J6S14_22425 [Clostridia bacterium]|nr:hypothetical protein [Clostridia bacterium]
MKNKCKRAKDWLNRNFNAYRQLDADKRMLEVMKNRLGSGVARYESDGSESHDSDKARARHEDALLDFSTQKSKVETEERRLIAETMKTKSAIDQLDDPALRAIATDRYINRLKWEDIATLEHISNAQVFRLNLTMLEKMADILDFI